MKLATCITALAISSLLAGATGAAEPARTKTTATTRTAPAPAAAAAVEAPAPAATNITTGAIEQKTDAAAPAERRASVTGFRSARFGMSEEEVRRAVAADFKITGAAIKSTENKSERTRLLTITAPDVLPGGGAAEVSYVFGYQSKKLIQVGVAWSKSADDKSTPEQLYSNANVLRSHFLAGGYKPETIATNMPIANGILMFRGSDNDGQTTMLMLQGAITQAEQAQQRVLTPSTLVLLYLADARKPDVYRIPDGLF